MNSNTSKVTLIKYDDESRMKLEFALEQVKCRRFVLPISTPAIIANVFHLAKPNPYTKYISLSEDLNKRMCGVSSESNRQLKLELETALACNPYFDAASVALKVFRLVLYRPSSYSAKRSPPVEASVSAYASSAFKVPRLAPAITPSPSLSVINSPNPVSAPPAKFNEEDDSFLIALRAFTRPIKPVPVYKQLNYNPNVLPQPELAVLMGNNASEEQANIMKDDLVNAVVDGHSGLIQYLSEGLQEYLFLESSLAKLPEYNRLTAEEVERFENHFLYFKKIKNLVVREMTPTMIETTVKDHADDTESDEDSVELLKSVKI